MRFDVLVTQDGGMLWRRHAGIKAMSPSAAIKRLVAGYSDYGEDHVRFHVVEAGKFSVYNHAGETKEMS